MDPLTVNALGPASLSGLSALRPAQPVAVPPPSAGGSADALALTTQDLAQGLFQRTLQAASQFPWLGAEVGGASLAQDASTTLFSALQAPQAAANTTPAPTQDSPRTAALAVAGATSTAPAANPGLVAPTALTTTTDSFMSSTSLEFALQTALRFGAGVQGAAFAPYLVAEPGSTLVRDAAAVSRVGALQPREGGPGPGDYAQPQGSAQQVLRSYGVLAAAAPAGADRVDFLA